MIGQTLGRYRIVEKLGQGGFGTVYKAYDPDLDRYVALKIWRSEIVGSPKFRDQAKNESKFNEKLIHPNIPALLAHEETDIYYDVNSYIEGNSLEDRIEQGPLPLDEANHILKQIANALDHVHGHGVLHCDIKPMNIHLAIDGKAYLIDWGMAREFTDIASRKGFTPGYAPLELYGKVKLTPATDVFSLGVTLYEMVTGRHPFPGRDAVVVLLKQENDPLLSPRSLRPDLPEAAERVIFKAMSTVIASRYQSAGDMAAAFAQALGNEIRPNERKDFPSWKKDLNKRVVILFLSADPTDMSRLRLGEELREIREKLQLAKLREHFILHERMSVRPFDISQALLDVRPDIVHFSGHGTSTGALCFENLLGEIQLISPDALTTLFEQFSSQVSVVILNTCYSEAQASAIAKHIGYVVALKEEMDDKTAVAFSTGFYQGLGAGRTIEDAYKLGIAQIKLQNDAEYSMPVLMIKGKVHI